LPAELLVDTQCSAQGVEVIDTKSRHLTEPEPGVSSCQHKDLIPTFDRFCEMFCLGGREETLLELFVLGKLDLSTWRPRDKTVGNGDAKQRERIW
jgi:hypothetical protein